MKKSVNIKAPESWENLTKFMIGLPGKISEELQKENQGSDVSELLEHLSVKNKETVIIKDLDIPVSEMFPGGFSDLHIDYSELSVKLPDQDTITLASDHLGKVTVKNIGGDSKESECKVTIDFKPKGLGFKLSTAMKAAFLVVPESVIQEELQELANEIDLSECPWI